MSVVDVMSMCGDVCGDVMSRCGDVMLRCGDVCG